MEPNDIFIDAFSEGSEVSAAEKEKARASAKRIGERRRDRSRAVTAIVFIAVIVGVASVMRLDDDSKNKLVGGTTTTSLVVPPDVISGDLRISGSMQSGKVQPRENDIQDSGKNIVWRATLPKLTGLDDQEVQDCVNDKFKGIQDQYIGIDLEIVPPTPDDPSSKNKRQALLSYDVRELNDKFVSLVWQGNVEGETTHLDSRIFWLQNCHMERNIDLFDDSASASSTLSESVEQYLQQHNLPKLDFSNGQIGRAAEELNGGKAAMISDNAAATSAESDGLHLLFEPSSIVPLKYGVIEVTVPWSEINGLLSSRGLEIGDAATAG